MGTHLREINKQSLLRANNEFFILNEIHIKKYIHYERASAKGKCIQIINIPTKMEMKSHI